MPAIASRPDERPSWKRLLLGALASILLWMPGMALASLSSGNMAGQTSAQNESFLHAVVMSALTFGAAVLMNRWFALRVIRAKGRSFWLLPFLTLPVASALMCVTAMASLMFSSEPGFPSVFHAIFGFGYGLLVALMIVMGTMLWLTYPLAILNQWMLRKIYSAGATAASSPVP